MKSAYEIAMEKLAKESGPQQSLSDEQREAIAAIDNQCDAKIAETRLNFDSIMEVATYEETPALREKLNTELRRIEDSRENKKNKIWGSE